MSDLASAKPSPRIVNGVIKWYEGDTFALLIEPELEDQDGEKIEIRAEDRIDVEFRNKNNVVVKEFSFVDIENNTIKLVFDEETTALFPKGDYRYTMRFTANERTTIAHRNNVCVE